MRSFIKLAFPAVVLSSAMVAGCTESVTDALHGFATDAGSGQGASSSGSGGPSSSGAPSSSGGCFSCQPADDASAPAADDAACTAKLCIDPVFDCPLQGCFNGCVSFHCI